MSGVNYKALGSIDLDCVEPESKPVCMRWETGDSSVTLHGSGNTIQLTPSQLIQISANSQRIIKDLK